LETFINNADDWINWEVAGLGTGVVTQNLRRGGRPKGELAERGHTAKQKVSWRYS
jgi:hypothetical protein